MRVTGQRYNKAWNSSPFVGSTRLRLEKRLVGGNSVHPLQIEDGLPMEDASRIIRLHRDGIVLQNLVWVLSQVIYEGGEWDIILECRKSSLDMSNVDMGGPASTLRDGECCAIKTTRKERLPMQYMSQTDREYRLPCPPLFRVRTTTSTTSPRNFRDSSRGLRFQ